MCDETFESRPARPSQGHRAGWCPCQGSQRVLGSLGNPLAHLFSLCFEQGVHPSNWKTANVVPVHKRKSRTDMKNYRPVSLLSVMSKVMEKVIKGEVRTINNRTYVKEEVA